MAPHALGAATLSIRLLWPFARVVSEREGERVLPRFPGIELKDLGNPDARVPHHFVMKALEEYVTSGDPLIGLRAGEAFDHADFDLIEFAARSAPDFGQAMTVVSRYLTVMNEAIEATLVVDGERAAWRLRTTDGVRQPAAANDFSIASSIAFSRRNVAVAVAPLEIWVAHPKPSYAAEYERRFQTRVRFSAPYNAIVMHRSRLGAPMRHASAEMAAAFELQVQRIVENLQNHEGLLGRVRFEVAEQFRTGSASMEKTARKLAMGVTTLRRKLEEDEGTTFSTIVDELRKELAERHLAGSEVTVSEVAFLLAFSDVRAFGRAFRRWTGQSPTEFRSSQRV
jgi:AraC-like DNA-binding protein